MSQEEGMNWCRDDVVFSVREGLPKKSSRSFGFCPNEGGGDSDEFSEKFQTAPALIFEKLYCNLF